VDKAKILREVSVVAVQRWFNSSITQER